MSFDVKRMVRFEHNVGSKDQKIRYAVGAAALLLSIFMGNIFLLLLGIILVGSAYLTWCPILSGLGKNTCETDSGAAASEAAPASPAEPAAGREAAAPAEVQPEPSVEEPTAAASDAPEASSGGEDASSDQEQASKEDSGS